MEIKNEVRRHLDSIDEMLVAASLGNIPDYEKDDILSDLLKRVQQLEEKVEGFEHWKS